VSNYLYSSDGRPANSQTERNGVSGRQNVGVPSVRD